MTVIFLWRLAMAECWCKKYEVFCVKMLYLWSILHTKPHVASIDIAKVSDCACTICYTLNSIQNFSVNWLINSLCFFRMFRDEHTSMNLSSKQISQRSSPPNFLKIALLGFRTNDFFIENHTLYLWANFTSFLKSRDAWLEFYMSFVSVTGFRRGSVVTETHAFEIKLGWSVVAYSACPASLVLMHHSLQQFQRICKTVKSTGRFTCFETNVSLYLMTRPMNGASNTRRAVPTP